MLPKPVVSFAAYFNKISSVLNFRLFSGICLLSAKDNCIVPSGFTLAWHRCHGPAPWVVLCQPQRMLSYMPPAVHNVPAHNIAQYSIAEHNIINPKQPKIP